MIVRTVYDHNGVLVVSDSRSMDAASKDVIGKPARLWPRGLVCTASGADMSAETLHRFHTTRERLNGVEFQVRFNGMIWTLEGTFEPVKAGVTLTANVVGICEKSVALCPVSGAPIRGGRSGAMFCQGMVTGIPCSPECETHSPLHDHPRFKRLLRRRLGLLTGLLTAPAFSALSGEIQNFGSLI